MRVVIAAAGTGGHINPGIAIANEIKKNEPDSEILFIGTPRGLENDLVPRAGYELKTIDAYGFSRKVSFDNIVKMNKNNKAVRDSYKILKEFNPDIVIGTGGYIGIPVCAEARRLNIPIVMHESNAYPGVTTKLVSRSAKKVLVGFEDAVNRLPKAKKIVVTGNPSKIKKIDYSEKEKEEKLNEIGIKKTDLPVVLVFGGSQGARSINNTMIQIIEKNMNKKYQIIWSVGKNNFDDVKQELENNNINIDELENVSVVPYIYNMQEIMNVADLVVCRSGAMTITEISILNKPAIFIPYPFATENHQEYNARVLESVGAAKIILDSELNENILNNMIDEIVENKEKMIEMGNMAEKIAIKNVDEKIYEEIKEIVKGDING